MGLKCILVRSIYYYHLVTAYMGWLASILLLQTVFQCRPPLFNRQGFYYPIFSVWLLLGKVNV